MYSNSLFKFTGSYFMIQNAKKYEAQDFKRQEDCVLKHHYLKDVGIGDSVLPVAKCFQIVLHAVLDFVEAIDRQISGVLAFNYYEMH